jgi:hypothetical protein
VYTSVEKAFQHKKAMFLKDHEVAGKIMREDSSQNQIHIKLSQESQELRSMGERRDVSNEIPTT